MTNWLPNIPEGSGPIYVRLADHIETAIADGVLTPGTKLPPQRNLAFDLGVLMAAFGVGAVATTLRFAAIGHRFPRRET